CLCGVIFCGIYNHRDTENSEVAQRKLNQDTTISILTICNAQTPYSRPPCGACLPSSSPHCRGCSPRRESLPPDDRSSSFHHGRGRRRRSTELPGRRVFPDVLRSAPDTSNRRRVSTSLQPWASRYRSPV